MFRFVHLCPPVATNQELYAKDKEAAESERNQRYMAAVDALGANLKARGIRCWVPKDRGWIKVDLLPRAKDIENELECALHGFAGYENSVISMKNCDNDILVRVAQDPFGGSLVEGHISKADGSVSWYGSLEMEDQLQPLDYPPEPLTDLIPIAKERLSSGRLTDMVIPWNLRPEEKEMIVARDTFMQSALPGGRFLVVASYSGEPLRPLDPPRKGQQVLWGKAAKEVPTEGDSPLPGQVRFLASKCVLISGSADGIVSIQTRKVAAKADGTVGPIPDGKLWTGKFDSENLPNRFKPAAYAVVHAVLALSKKS